MTYPDRIIQNPERPSHIVAGTKDGRCWILIWSKAGFPGGDFPRGPAFGRGQARSQSRPAIRKAKRMKNENQFTATKWDTVADKEKFLAQFQRFVSGGMLAKDFPKWFYQRLSNTFGHIAHYDQGGFFATWFDTNERKVEFLDHAAQGGGYGDSAFCYSDVERTIKSWLTANPQIREKYAATRDAGQKQAELAALRELAAKYPTEVAALVAA